MFKHILVALDGSAASNAGLKSALRLASDQHASITGVSVIDDAAITGNFDGAYLPASYVDVLYDSLRENGRTILAKAESAARSAGVAFVPLLVESRGQTVAHAILQQARKAKVDAIVIGTHGRRGLSRILMGSDAEAVVRESPVPVLLVRSAQRTTRGRSTSAKSAPATPRNRRPARRKSPPSGAKA
jgi:nucleotide-binding universal stress UspA family protein